VEGGIGNRRFWAQAGINMAIAAGEALLMAGLRVVGENSSAGGARLPAAGEDVPPEVALAEAQPVNVYSVPVTGPYTEVAQIPDALLRRVTRPYRPISEPNDGEIHPKSASDTHVVLVANLYHLSDVMENLSRALSIDVELANRAYRPVVARYPVEAAGIVSRHSRDPGIIRDMMQMLNNGDVNGVRRYIGMGKMEN
jgi:hypothetical protein